MNWKLFAASLLPLAIGKRINYYSHARHGCYMLVNSKFIWAFPC